MNCPRRDHDHRATFDVESANFGRVQSDAGDKGNRRIQANGLAEHIADERKAADVLEADFAARLRDLIAPAAPPPARVVSTAFAPKAGTPPFPLPPRELSAWLGILIALVFLAERLLASRRRRFAP